METKLYADDRVGDGGRPVQISGAQLFERGPEAWTLLYTSFCLSLWDHYLSIVRINPSRPSPSHSATDSQSSLFGVKIFSRSALVGRGEKMFPPGLQPAPGDTDKTCNSRWPIAGNTSTTFVAP